jgi:hypothetical protein
VSSDKKSHEKDKTAEQISRGTAGKNASDTRRLFINIPRINSKSQRMPSSRYIE